jgi:hypothetical protein
MIPSIRAGRRGALVVTIAVAIVTVAAHPAAAQRPIATVQPMLSRQIPNYHPTVLSRTEIMRRLRGVAGGPALLTRITAPPSQSASSTAALSTSSTSWVATSGSTTFGMMFFGAYGTANDAQSIWMRVGGSPESFVYFTMTQANAAATPPQLYVLSVDLFTTDPSGITFMVPTGTIAPNAPPTPGNWQVISSCQTSTTEAMLVTCVVAVPVLGQLSGAVMQSNRMVPVLGATLQSM